MPTPIEIRTLLERSLALLRRRIQDVQTRISEVTAERNTKARTLAAQEVPNFKTATLARLKLSRFRFVGPLVEAEFKSHWNFWCFSSHGHDLALERLQMKLASWISETDQPEMRAQTDRVSELQLEIKNLSEEMARIVIEMNELDPKSQAKTTASSQTTPPAPAKPVPVAKPALKPAAVLEKRRQDDDDDGVAMVSSWTYLNTTSAPVELPSVDAPAPFVSGGGGDFGGGGASGSWASSGEEKPSETKQESSSASAWAGVVVTETSCVNDSIATDDRLGAFS